MSSTAISTPNPPDLRCSLLRLPRPLSIGLPAGVLMAMMAVTCCPANEDSDEDARLPVQQAERKSCLIVFAYSVRALAESAAMRYPPGSRLVQTRRGVSLVSGRVVLGGCRHEAPESLEVPIPPL